MWFFVLVLLLMPLVGPPAWADVDFDATDDAATTGVALSNFITNTEGTMMAWFTSTAVGLGTLCWDARRIVGDDGVYASLGNKESNFWCAYNNDGGGDQRVNTHVTDVPTHLAWVHTGGQLYLYLNGTAAASNTSGNTSVLTSAVSVGKGSFGAAPSGRIHNIQTFNVALPPATILAYASNRSEWIAGTPHPTAHWRFHCPDGSNADGVAFPDVSGNGRTLTGTDGATNGTLTCKASTLLNNPYGVQ